ncbi:uncharacterized protein LOC130939680 [Arachis stenosperma]|uniref:uncharacterized protein LOC130939680 n=1 Tax=Arachis stenosperma TaxID=217475 RepID=UPI0025AD4C90|nr:uncharacterized protein LOC130939680 [Arachis stenosperma]
MKTPPNSEDELEEVDSDEVLPVFRERGRFGELRLEIGMTFTTKMEFKEDIKTFIDNYTCARETKNKLAKKWLACKLVKKALGDAKTIVYGEASAQCGMVTDYGQTLLKSNPGSTVTEFLASCKPLIDLDGAFLKTQHGGQILSAIGQDANNHIYVITYAIVPVENTKNWRWFLELLHQDLGDYKQNKLYFISDMQKGLVLTVKEIFSDVHHRFCVWHLWKNFNKQWKDLQLRGLPWNCARMPCMHACAALARNGKRPDECCYQWLTMEAYNNTYVFHINPILGQTKRNCAKRAANEEVAANGGEGEAKSAPDGKGPCSYPGSSYTTRADRRQVPLPSSDKGSAAPPSQTSWTQQLQPPPQISSKIDL